MKYRLIRNNILDIKCTFQDFLVIELSSNTILHKWIKDLHFFQLKLLYIYTYKSTIDLNVIRDYRLVNL